MVFLNTKLTTGISFIVVYLTAIATPVVQGLPATEAQTDHLVDWTLHLTVRPSSFLDTNLSIVADLVEIINAYQQALQDMSAVDHTLSQSMEATGLLMEAAILRTVSARTELSF
ncbi:hypothetical protein F5051DRAFT_441530 [Lentinula edodes]|nr:hypothetical protein F5051DRAFT_441530 [Lentinula edodes]